MFIFLPQTEMLAAKDEDGNTPLMLAVESERFKFATLCINKGRVKYIGNTPLMLAVESARFKFATLCINKGRV